MARRVLLDVRDRQPTGVSRYAINAARNFVQQCDDEITVGILHEPHQVAEISDLPALHETELVPARRQEQFVRFDRQILEQIERFRPDDYHSFANFIDPRVPARQSVTVHDLIRLQGGHRYDDRTFAGRYSDEEFANLKGAVQELRMRAPSALFENTMTEYLSRIVDYALSATEFVLTPSASTMALLQAREPSAPMWVEPPHVAPVFAPRESVTGDSSSFLLFVGTPDRHKRLDIVEHYCRSIPRSRRPRLVCVGDRAGHHLYERVDEPVATGSHVERLGQVSDERLRDLYATALATVLPSVVEGFGLPADESIAAGGRVLATDIDVFRERLAPPDAEFFVLTSRSSFLAALAEVEVSRETGRGHRARVGGGWLVAKLGGAS